MSIERPAGKDGKHYFLKPQAAIEGDGLVGLTQGWYLVKSRKPVGSALPEGKGIGTMFHAAEGVWTPAEGDVVIPLGAEVIEWATDGEVTGNRGTTEDTVQGDVHAHFADEGYPSSTYSLSGYNRIDDELQKELKARSGYVTVDDGTGVITVTEPKGDEIAFATCYRSSNVSGETEEWSLVSGLITSLTLNKPLKGNQDFSLQMQVNYRDTYVRTIA